MKYCAIFMRFSFMTYPCEVRSDVRTVGRFDATVSGYSVAVRDCAKPWMEEEEILRVGNVR
jgi:hypothetical protein